MFTLLSQQDEQYLLQVVRHRYRLVLRFCTLQDRLSVCRFTFGHSKLPWMSFIQARQCLSALWVSVLCRIGIHYWQPLSGFLQSFTSSSPYFSTAQVGNTDYHIDTHTKSLFSIDSFLPIFTLPNRFIIASLARLSFFSIYSSPRRQVASTV